MMMEQWRAACFTSASAAISLGVMSRTLMRFRDDDFQVSYTTLWCSYGRAFSQRTEECCKKSHQRSLIRDRISLSPTRIGTWRDERERKSYLLSSYVITIYTVNMKNCLVINCHFCRVIRINGWRFASSTFLSSERERAKREFGFEN